MTRALLGAMLLQSVVSPNRVWLRLRLPVSSPYLVGHFPNEAILPGIAQLELALHAACLLAGTELVLTGARGVRLRRALRPDDEFDLIVTRGDALGDVHFEVRAAEGRASNGILEVSGVAAPRV